MPVDPAARPDTAPILDLTLWPHRSLSPRGFRWMLWLTTLGFAIPMGAILGSAAFWIVGAFVLVDFVLLYGLMKLTYRSGQVRETVRLWPDRLRIERREPNGAEKVWEANPHWVRVRLVETRRIPDYLVVSSAGKDIELGAFLTPGERRDLAGALRTGLRQAAERR